MSPNLRISDSPRENTAVVLFAGAVLSLWLVQSLAVLVGAAHYPREVNLLTKLWLFGYSAFSFNTCLNFGLNAVGVWLRRPKMLAELSELPVRTTALLCPIFKEDPAMLLPRLEATLRGNGSKDLSCWVLSDSPASHEAAERAMVQQLRAIFPDWAAQIRYRRRQKNTDYKSGNITEFLYCYDGFAYDYLVVIDSDSLLPAGTVRRLLAKAEHPDNASVFLFQTKLTIYHARTRWAQFQKTGCEIGNRLHLPVLLYGQGPSWGHNCLIRTNVLRRMYEYAEPHASGDLVRRPLPTQERSHDVFDFVYGSILGYSVQYVSDVETYEEAPSSLGISAARQERWARGSLSATKLLLEPKASLYARFLVWHGAVGFLNSVFLFWLLLSLWLAAHPGAMNVHFSNDCVAGPIIANRTLLSISVFSVLTYFGFPLLVADRTLPLRRIAGHLLLSSLILMQQLTSGVIVLLKVLLMRAGGWTPTGLLAIPRRPALLSILACIAASAFAGWQMFQILHVQWWMLVAAPAVIGGIFCPFLSAYLNHQGDAR